MRKGARLEKIKIKKKTFSGRIVIAETLQI